jgi:hypothetical protein
MEEDECLFKRGADGILLKCINTKEAMQVMAEVHEGIFGAHQSGIKMKWLIHRYGYYWPKILKYCIEYAHGCEACQKHGPLPKLPAAELSSIIKPWPFRGWEMDLIGKVRPTSRKKNCFYHRDFLGCRHTKRGSPDQADQTRQGSTTSREPRDRVQSTFPGVRGGLTNFDQV